MCIYIYIYISRIILFFLVISVYVSLFICFIMSSQY